MEAAQDAIAHLRPEGLEEADVAADAEPVGLRVGADGAPEPAVAEVAAQVFEEARALDVDDLEVAARSSSPGCRGRGGRGRQRLARMDRCALREK